MLINDGTLGAGIKELKPGAVAPKRQPHVWWSVEVEETVSERRKAYAAAHRSDKNCQAYTFASQHASSVIAKAKAEA